MTPFIPHTSSQPPRCQAAITSNQPSKSAGTAAISTRTVE
jgi:hypothetical protein